MYVYTLIKGFNYEHYDFLNSKKTEMYEIDIAIYNQYIKHFLK